MSAIRLSPPQRLILYTVGVGLWASGVLWLLFHSGVGHHDEFGLARHPLEPWCLALHGAFAVGGTWTFGWLARAHIVRGWSAKRRRRSGSLLVGLVVWLVVSGYLLYYLGDERLRSITSLFHWSIGLMMPLAFVLHRVRAGSRQWWIARLPAEGRFARIGRRHVDARSCVSGSREHPSVPGIPIRRRR